MLLELQEITNSRRENLTHLRRAETLAGVETQKGSLWHAYRRGWATARLHLPAADVAELGGWGGTETLEKVYQHIGTMLAIVSTRHELREGT